MLRRQFREVVSALTRHTHAPQPTQRRKRKEETEGRFSLAATQIMRRKVGLPAAAYAAVAFLSDTLDWLNPWHHETTSTGDLDESFHNAAEPNHLFPHL